MKKPLFILALACAVVSTPAVAQQAVGPGYKDPGTAMIVSVLIPGGGQLYTGETGRGLTIMGVGLGGLVLGVAATTSSVGISCDDDFDCEDDTNYLPMAAGYLAYFGSWIYGIIDADDSAGRMNTKRGLARAVPGNVSPVVAPAARGGAEVGVTVRF
jgi:hypothetical protein